MRPNHPNAQNKKKHLTKIIIKIIIKKHIKRSSGFPPDSHLIMGKLYRKENKL